MRSLGARRWWALAALALAVLTASLDVTIMNVALPTLAGALHASESDLTWFVSAFTLALAAAMLPGGLVGDLIGRKRILLGALVLFAAGSIASAYASSPTGLIVAQAALGIGGAAIIINSLAVITTMFSAEERPTAVGMWAAANFLAMPLGPILGGWILTNLWWGWAFLINVPVALLAMLAVLALVPESRAATRPGVDLLGIVLSSAGLTALVYGVIEAGKNGWGDSSALVPLMAGAVLLVAFVSWEAWLGGRTGGKPLVDLRVFGSASFTWGSLLVMLGTFAMFGALLTLPQYFQAVMGTDAQGAGLRMLPLIGGMIVGAAVSDRLAVWIGAKLTCALAFVVMAAGMAVGAQTVTSSTEAFAAGWMVVVGLGVGLMLASAASTALGGLPPEHSGVGSGVMAAFQRIGAVFGAAVLGSVLNSTYQDHLQVSGLPAAAASAAGKSVFAGEAVARQLQMPSLIESVRVAFVNGMDVAVTVAAGVAVVGLLLALLFLPGPRAVAFASEPDLDEVEMVDPD